jgi:hypothetical protein
MEYSRNLNSASVLKMNEHHAREITALKALHAFELSSLKEQYAMETAKMQQEINRLKDKVEFMFRTAHWFVVLTALVLHYP